MSSEGSVSTSSSGIRQFGLYRTIDARTEEFLRLSRKRQIRQGCACAAISTAITVAVVISIILIYEYSIIYESAAKTTLKPSWLSLMNKSADAIPFEAKLNKAKINLDPVYIQFLPLILKTLKKNKYFDKIIEDDSTQGPVYDKRETQEDLSTKNIFSDTRNWMRMPTSRFYTIEYKTSPIVYFKNPTRNIDRFRKIRRIRDYERVMNYVDKMISEKVSYGSTLPILKNTYSFHRKPTITTYTTPMTKVAENLTKNLNGPNKFSTSDKVLSKTDNKPNCRCPKKISELLNKLIKSLQKLIPDFSEHISTTPCNEKKDTTVRSITIQSTSKNLSKPTTKSDVPNAIFNTFSINNNNCSLKAFMPENKTEIPISVTNSLEIPKIQLISTPNNDQIMMPHAISKTLYSIKSLPIKMDNSLNSIKVLQHNILQDTIHNKKYNFYTTNAEHVIEGTEENSPSQEDTTKPMLLFSTTNNFAPNSAKTVRDFILQKADLRNTTKSLLEFPPLTNSEYEDYIINTTPNGISDFTLLDKNVYETNILKDKNQTEGNENEIDLSTKYPHYDYSYSIEHENNNKTWNIVKKMGELALSTAISEKSYDFTYNTTEQETTTSTDKISNQITDALKTNLESSQTTTQTYIIKNNIEEQLKSEDVTLEEEIDRGFNEEIIPEENLKSLENVIQHISISEKHNKTLTRKSPESDQVELAVIEEPKRNYSKSMIPVNRSSYLEIQRNDWKLEEHHDYDDNLNNDLFE